MTSNRFLCCQIVEYLDGSPWRTTHDTATRDTTLGVHLADLETHHLSRGDRVCLTFYWPDAGRWEQVDFLVCIE